jgi:hypothetical protein
MEKIMKKSTEKNTDFVSGNSSDSYQLLDFESAQVVSGFVNDTYILIVSGTKPYLNMVVELSPRIYVRQPKYWGIEVVGSIPGGIGLPALGSYSVSKQLMGITGTKGIEVIGASNSLEIDVPPDYKKQIETARDKEQLCNERGDVEYRANQVHNTVFLIATGTHGSPNFKVFFEQSLIDIFPPQFILKHIRPSGVVIQLETPFVAVTHFKAAEEIKELTIHDAQGAHTVRVDQTPD